MSLQSFRWHSEDEQPLPEPGFIRKVAEDVWEGLFSMVMWTLVLWVLGGVAIVAGVASAPLGLIVAACTLAPAVAGMMFMVGKMARGGFARVGDAWRGTLRLYGRSVALALPLVLVAALILATANIVRAFPDQSELFIAWALQLGIGLLIVAMHVYLFPVLALYDSTLKQTVGLAVVLAGRHVWQTVVLLALGAGLLALGMYIPLTWLLAPGVWCVVVMNATWRMARRLMPNPAGIDK